MIMWITFVKGYILEHNDMVYGYAYRMFVCLIKDVPFP